MHVVLSMVGEILPPNNSFSSVEGSNTICRPFTIFCTWFCTLSTYIEINKKTHIKT